MSVRVAHLTDDQLEQIVMEEMARAERNGLAVKRDCELTLARMVAVRLRKIAKDRQL